MTKKFSMNILLNAILFVSAIFFICIYFIFTCSLITTNNTIEKVLLPVFLILIVVLPIIFRKFLKNFFKKLYVPMKIFFTFCLIFYMVSFIIFFSFVINYSQNTIDVFSENYSSNDNLVIIVFGCRTNGYTPSATLEKRLLKTY